MKNAILCTAILLASLATSRADKFQFVIARFNTIQLTTSKGKEHIVISQGSKTEDEVVFDKDLKPGAAQTFTTAGGIVFTLKHLDKPIINDHNRHINSGEWQLTMSGAGEEFEKLKSKMPFVAFAETLPPLTFLGDKLTQ